MTALLWDKMVVFGPFITGEEIASKINYNQSGSACNLGSPNVPLPIANVFTCFNDLKWNYQGKCSWTLRIFPQYFLLYHRQISPKSHVYKLYYYLFLVKFCQLKSGSFVPFNP